MAGQTSLADQTIPLAGRICPRLLSLGWADRTDVDNSSILIVSNSFWDSVDCPLLSPAEMAAIRKDLAIFKKAESVTDSGIRQVIQDWILEAEKMLAKEAEKDS